MAETPKVTPQNQKAFDLFVKEFNLDPLNKDAINFLLFDLVNVAYENRKAIEELQKQYEELKTVCLRIAKGERYMIRWTNEECVDEKINKMQAQIDEIAKNI